jgi:hypothetical protein
MQSEHENLLERFNKFFDPRFPTLFVLGSIAFAVGSGAIYELVRSLIPEKASWLVLFVLSIVAFSLVFIVAGIIHLYSRWKSRNSVIEAKVVTKVERVGVIIPLSPHKAIAKKIIDNQKPRYVGFLFSDLSTKTLQDLLADYAGTLKLDENAFARKVDATNVESVYSATRDIALEMLSKQGVERSDLAIDVTGGTVPMSIGAYRAAEEVGISTQYVSSKYDSNGKRIEGSQEIDLLTRAL